MDDGEIAKAVDVSRATLYRHLDRPYFRRTL
jgi:hypothetical protein